MSRKLFKLLKILPGKGNSVKREVYRKAPPGIYNFLIEKGYAKKADPEDVPKADKGKTLTQTNARRLVGNMAKEKGDQKTLDFLNKPNPASKSTSKTSPSTFEREFNLDKKNAIKQIDNTLSKLREDYSKASPGVQKNIKRQADKLNKKKESIKSAKFSARAKANLENPLFDVTQDIKRSTKYLKNIVKDYKEKSKGNPKDVTYAQNVLSGLELGKSASREFGGTKPRQATAKRSGQTLTQPTDTVETRKVIVDKKGKVIGIKPGTKPNVKQIQTSSEFKDLKLTPTDSVEDEAASIFEAAEQLRGVSKVSSAEKKKLEKQIQKYIEGGGKITKGPPSKGTAPDDTPGLRDSLVEAQKILGVDAPPGFAPNNVGS